MVLAVLSARRSLPHLFRRNLLSNCRSWLEVVIFITQFLCVIRLQHRKRPVHNATKKDDFSSAFPSAGRLTRRRPAPSHATGQYLESFLSAGPKKKPWYIAGFVFDSNQISIYYNFRCQRKYFAFSESR